MAHHNVTVSIDRKTITVDGKPLAIECWPENDIALTGEGAWYTAGPNVGHACEPCDDCGEPFVTADGTYNDDGSFCAGCRAVAPVQP